MCCHRQPHEDGSGVRSRDARYLSPGGRIPGPGPAVEFPPRYAGGHFPESHGELRSERLLEARMAVYRRTYTTYSGAMTPAWSRFLILFRYSRRNLFRSRFQTGFFVACFFYPAMCLIAIYLAHNLSFLQKL